MSPEIKVYINNLSDDRKEIILKIRKAILDNLPQGFEECINYNMIGFVVPQSIYPNGYHCNPSLPLPFINLASQKGHIALYHMGMYGDAELKKWFEEKYTEETGKKANSGKSCMRYKKDADVPYQLIGELVSKITVADWIEKYEKLLVKK